jgi:hypothetical protein
MSFDASPPPRPSSTIHCQWGYFRHLGQELEKVETPKPFADAPWREDSGLGIASQDAEPFALVFLREQNDEFVFVPSASDRPHFKTILSDFK